MKRFISAAFVVLAATGCSLSVARPGEPGRDGDDGAKGDPGPTGSTGATGPTEDRASILTKLAGMAFKKSVGLNVLSGTVSGTAVTGGSNPSVRFPATNDALHLPFHVPVDARDGQTVTVKLAFINEGVPTCTADVGVIVSRYLREGVAAPTPPAAVSHHLDLSGASTATYDTYTVGGIDAEDVMFLSVQRTDALGGGSCTPLTLSAAWLIYDSDTP